MDLIRDFIQNIWMFTTDISVYIILGLIFAGVIKQLIPDSFIKKHIGKNSLGAVIKAAILGIPLPLCSCSVIPFASSLKKSGASKSALQTFLIATPITGVDSIMATYGIFGWFFTLYRVISSVCISLFAGILSMLFIKEKTSTPPLWSSAGPSNKATLEVKITPQKKNFFIAIFDYAFNTLFKDMAKALLIGIVLAAFFSSIIPQEFSRFFSENLFLSYFLLIVISAPMYVCAISSLPIGLTLLLSGFSPGSAFVFLSAGPATNLVTISVVKKLLGTKSTLIYLGSVVLGSIFFAYILDIFFFENVQNTFHEIRQATAQSGIDVLFAIIMFILFAKYLVLKKKKGCCCS